MLFRSDLNRALELYDKSSEDESIFQMTKKAVLLLKTRVALYTENWDDVITYGEQLYGTGISLENIGKLAPEEMATGAISTAKYSFIKKSNPEILFSFGGDPYDPHKYISSFISYMGGPSFTTSQGDADALFDQYEEGDNRLYAFFMQDITESDGTVNKYIHAPMKYYSLYSESCYKQRSESVV